MKSLLLKFICILCVLVIRVNVGAQKTYRSSIDVPFLQEKLFQKISGFDSVILYHSCSAEGCGEKFAGVAFKKNKLYAINFDFSSIHSKQDLSKWEITSRLITDLSWQKSIRQINFGKIMLLKSDSLNYTGANKECIVSDGGTTKIISIRDKIITKKGCNDPWVTQKCCYTSDRQFLVL
jgi:hypothetical protein